MTLFHVEVQAGSGGARVGRLTSVGSDDVSRALETPRPVLLTRRGSMPFVPAQVAEDGLNAASSGRIGGGADSTSCCGCYQIPFLDFFYLNANTSMTGSKLLAENFPHGVRQFAHTQGEVLILSSRAAGQDDFVGIEGGSGKNYVSGEARADSRRIKVTAAAMLELQAALLCDLAEVPSIPCKPGTSPKHVARAVDRSLTILDEAIAAWTIGGQPTRLLGAIQGGTNSAELRRSATELKRRADSLAGYVVACLHVGESWDQRQRAMSIVGDELKDSGKLCVAAGNGSPDDVLLCVSHGVDLVESSYPFDLAEMGLASDLRSGRTFSLRDESHELDRAPLSPECRCQTCMRHSRAYLYHLLNVHEMIGHSLLALHNLQDYLDFFQRIRQSIRSGRFAEFREEFDAMRVPPYLN